MLGVRYQYIYLFRRY